MPPKSKMVKKNAPSTKRPAARKTTTTPKKSKSSKALPPPCKLELDFKTSNSGPYVYLVYFTEHFHHSNERDGVSDDPREVRGIYTSAAKANAGVVEALRSWKGQYKEIDNAIAACMKGESLLAPASRETDHRPSNAKDIYFYLHGGDRHGAGDDYFGPEVAVTYGKGPKIAGTCERLLKVRVGANRELFEGEVLEFEVAARQLDKEICM